MSKHDDDFENGLIDFDEWIKQRNIENGYVFCQTCTDKTNGNWEVWVNPQNLCEHLKEKTNERKNMDL